MQLPCVVYSDGEFDLRTCDCVHPATSDGFKSSFTSGYLGRIAIGDTIEMTIGIKVNTQQKNLKKYLSLHFEIMPSDERKIVFGDSNEKFKQIELVVHDNCHFEYVPVMIVNGCDCVKNGGVAFEVPLQPLQFKQKIDV